jgi:fructoselysine 6-kinase
LRVVLAGDCGVDRYVGLGVDRAGGITLNVAAHARRLFPRGDSIAVLTALGTDSESAVVREALSRLGVECFLRELPGRTSLQIIDIEPSGEKIFVSYHQGVLGDYRVGEEERSLIAESDLLVAPHYRQIDGFFSSLMDSPSRGLRAVDFADIAEEPVTTNVERFLDRLDVAFFGLRASDHDFIAELETIARARGKLFVVTLGPDGSMALGRTERHFCPAVPVTRVVDTTGAGDTFAAAFLAEYVRSENVSRSLARGAAEAAETVQRVGAF